MRQKMAGEIDFLQILQAQQTFDEQQQQLEGHPVGLNVVMQQDVVRSDDVGKGRNRQVARVELVIGYIVVVTDQQNPHQREERKHKKRAE